MKRKDYLKELKKYQPSKAQRLMMRMVEVIHTLVLKAIDFIHSPFLPAAVFGALFTLGFAPYSLFPIIFCCLYGILHLLDHANTRKQAFFIGWFFGFSHYISSLYWFSYALLTDAERFGWMVPFALLLIPAILGIYTGLITLFTFHFSTSRFQKVLAFSTCWVAVEILRTYFVIPFPWNLLGHSLIADLSLAQITYYIGIFGASFLIAFSGAIFYTRKHFTIFVVLLLWFVIYATGFLRINSAQTEFYTDYKIRLVQPFNIHHFGDDFQKSKSIERLAELSVQNRPDDLKYIIWPEAAFPYGFYLETRFLPNLSKLAPKDGALILGSDRFVLTDDLKALKQIYNSIYAINSASKIISVYDKSVLVPFGEYVPFRSILPNIPKVTEGILDFTKGEKEDFIFNIHGLPKFRPMVCYEVIFPEIQINTESEWILNITNDAWYGDSIGPYQHYSMARIKAVETGLPLVRVANSGISAVINSHGEEITKLALGEMSYFDFNLPKTGDLKNHILFKWFVKLSILLLFLYVISFEFFVKKNYHSSFKNWVLK